MFSNKLTAILLPALLLLTLFFASLFFLNTIINASFVRQPLLRHLSDALDYDLSTDKIELSLWAGIGISAINLEARSREGLDNIVASKMRVKLHTRSLLNGRIVPTRIYLYQPTIELAIKDRWQSSNSDPPLSIKDTLIHRLTVLPSISLQDARLVFKDLSWVLEDLYLRVSRSAKTPEQFEVSVRGKAEYEQHTAPFTLRGTLTQDEATGHRLFTEISLKSEHVPLPLIPWPATLPVKRGHAGIDVKVTGPRNGAFSIAGKLAIDDMHLTLIRGARQNNFSLSQSVFSFESAYSGRTLQIPSLHLETPDFTLAARSKIDFQQMENPHLSLTVESPFMPLQTFKKIFPTALLPRWIDKKLTPILVEASVRVDQFTLDGTFEQFQNLEQPENAHALSMGLTWKALKVRVDENTLPFENVSGQLRIKNGALRLSPIKASFGQSILEHGAMDIRKIFADHDAYEIAIDGFFDLQDLQRQKQLALLPTNWLEGIPDVESVSGGLSASARIHYSRGGKHPRIVKGDFSFKHCKINDKEFLFPLKVEAAEIRVGEKGEDQFKAKGLWGNSYFETTGSVEDFLKTRRADIVARADMNELIRHFYPGILSSVHFRDLLPCRISLSRPQQSWSFRGEVDAEGMILDSSAFSINPKGGKSRITFDLDLQPLKKLHFKQLYWELGDSTLELSGLYNLSDKTLTNFQVNTPGLSLENMGIQFKRKNLGASGTLRCRATINASLKDPLNTTVHGELEGQEISVAGPQLSSLIGDGQFKVRFSGKTALLRFLKLKLGQSPIHIRGRLEGWDGMKGDLTVNADYLNAADLLTKETKHLSGAKRTDLPNFINRTDINIKLNAARGQWQSFECGPLEAEGALRMGRLYISRSKIQFDGGLLTVNGYVSMGKESGMAFSNYVNITDQPAEIIQPLLRSMGIEENLEGRLTMEAVLYMRGKNKEELFHSLAGGANVLVEKGTIRKSNVIFKILDFLSLQKIFKRKPSDVSKEAFYFESIGGHIKIGDGILQTDNLDMKSPVFNVAGKGRLDLEAKWVDFDLGVQPLGTMDSLVSMIPIAGYILTGEKKRLLIYYFKVEGNLPNPEVRYVPFKNLGSGIVGFFKRAFLTPRRLFEKLPKGSEDLANEDEPSPYEGP